MRNAVAISLWIWLVIGCEVQEDAPGDGLADLNLYLQTDLEIDSVFVANITQDREYQFLPYSDTLKVMFNNSINDQYHLNFYTNDIAKGLIMHQLWLDGEEVVVKGRLTNKLELDTVIGSDLYYKSLDFRNRYKEFEAQSPDSATTNQFLLDELRNHQDNPFSMEIAGNFLYRNVGDKKELRKAFEILSQQEEWIREHRLNPFQKIENILTVGKVDFSGFRFYDTEERLVSIHPAKGERFLLDFWFVGCAPCIKEHEVIARRLDWLETNHVKVIGISIDKDHGKWRNFLDKKEYGWANYREIDDYEKRMRNKMLITNFPTYLLINHDGTIMHRAHSYVAVEDYLTQ